jgi:hypothetical protein
MFPTPPPQWFLETSHAPHQHAMQRGVSLLVGLPATLSGKFANFSYNIVAVAIIIIVVIILVSDVGFSIFFVTESPKLCCLFRFKNPKP